MFSKHSCLIIQNIHAVFKGPNINVICVMTDIQECMLWSSNDATPARVPLKICSISDYENYKILKEELVIADSFGFNSL